jgi:hypothetical protein
MDATADLKKGLRWRLKNSRTSPAWITSGRDAVDVLHKKVASEELRRHLLSTTTPHPPLPDATMTPRSRERRRGGKVEEVAGPYQSHDGEIGPPSIPKGLPRTRGDGR